ncbi:MAG: hypothetical protein R3246_02710 [Acidimicrobiia bacterium]|nr:hypothetical protein [Acidimicrobiia bacterium]
MDVAVNLVESYLRLNGYLTLSELEVRGRNQDGTFDTLTDVDIVGIRFPGDTLVAETGSEDQLLLIADDTLDLSDDRIDVIIGEVKQGEAVFNPGLSRREVLRSILRRMEWVYAQGIDGVVDRLSQGGISFDPARGGGEIRTRMVAFGQSPKAGAHTIPIGHVIESLVAFMDEYDDVLRSAQFKEPAPALLRLLVKAGFSVGR